MSSLEDLYKLTFQKIFLFVLLIASLTSPGVLIIWYFAPPLIASLNTPKLVALAISITAPLYLFTLIIFGACKKDFVNMLFSQKSNTDKEFLSSAIIYECCVATMGNLLISLGVSCWNSWNWHAFLILVVLFQVVMSLVLAIIFTVFQKHTFFNKSE